MFTLRWKHTRTGKDMKKVFDTYGQVWVRISMIRKIFQDHPFILNEKPI